jgi:hypothetical protein
MKKLLTIIILLLNLSIFSQVNFPNAKQYLKEFLAIQSLLAENRTDDLKTFFLNYKYIAMGASEKSMFMKLDLDELTKDNDLIPVITVMSGGENEYVDNYIEITFFKKQNNKPQILLSLEDCISIKKIMQNLYETGATYPLLKAYDKYKKTNSINIEKVDRYTYKIYSDDNPSKIKYEKASNFFRMAALDKNKVDNVAFFGPGKIMLTEMIYIEPVKSKVEGKYSYKMQIASWKLKDAESTEKIDVDFFMAIKNFNDRIWLDK